MIFKKGRYSGFIHPILLILDLIIINVFAFTLPILFEFPVLFHGYITVAWIILSFKTKFYEINRFSKAQRIAKLLVRQFLFFFLILYAFIGFFKQPNISRLNLGLFFITVFGSVLVLKFLMYYFLKVFWKRAKERIRKVVVVGENEKTKQLIKMFADHPENGFQLIDQFDPKTADFSTQKCLDFIKENSIDEIYCSVQQLKNNEITQFVNYADNNLIYLKFIPDNREIFTKELKLEYYYEYLPILSLRKIPLDDPFNRFYKRLFDFMISFFVVVFILSWLFPIIGFLILLDSKGPVYFIQNRPGFHEEGFHCYKFRTMHTNDNTEKSATRNDPRITRLGAFLRRTSIDELPQFFNVLMGDMSIVGPRPHLWRQNHEYNTTVQKYMLRHHVNPGITGLAQTKGYRGEIETEEDIINRVRYDVFYIENWSIWLDVKIMIQTGINIIKGEEKAY
ncbi:exopolysaccharide biosynthesis polyprenyl glycosylphosphotransferase [Maribacter polysaccharolyticus]|uniref:exopolysaccharide biosynthesis polyprenyl glycosylphosphotransferase n=1 Tax=Maribacter polysaccharolyticus TaxID=3020831 RepID=UPI00237F2B00|nr:exopolysaccharide biosynthesis polyprenyl glycosylphosphotransferase [Maribacter polysaccharolyticus]MDE3742227.1 exopolysaccharide biosynthesis polyprenyl glycosylphosphotransferase [Maribacter polysaccharolyticus]